jgi:hypothetical protein
MVPPSCDQSVARTLPATGRGLAALTMRRPALQRKRTPGLAHCCGAPSASIQSLLNARLRAVTIWEIIVIWALGASVAVTLAMLVALAIILWASRKLD